MQGALLEGFWLLRDYAREHVLLCLVPAFFIAGAIGQFVSQGAVLRYLGAKAPRPVAYGVASVSGSILAVCSCTVLPLFASIYRRGAGLGPATAFLYSGPAINVLAMILTARVLGLELGLARAIGAVLFAVVVGSPDGGPVPPRGGRAAAKRRRPLRGRSRRPRAAAAVAGRPLPRHHGGDPGLRQLGSAEPGGGLLRRDLPRALAAHRGAPRSPPLDDVALVLDATSCGEWVQASWAFAKQITPLLLAGILVSGWLMGRPGDDAGLVPSSWVAGVVGGNSLGANVLASVVGALMYFATLTEVPILQTLLGSGMGQGPALALLLAGPALSLPNMLVINSYLGPRKTIAYVTLVVVMATGTGWLYGALVG